MRGCVNVRKVKKRKMRAAGVVTTIVMLPVLVIFAANNSPFINQLAKNATVISAGMTFWDNNTNQVEDVATDVISVQKSMTISDNNIVSSDFDETKIIAVNSLWGIEMAPEEIETPAKQQEKSQPQQNINDILQALPYPSSLDKKSGT